MRFSAAWICAWATWMRADTWYLKKAPKDPLHFDALKRYQYLTQAVVELVAGQTKNVFLTLAPMDSYCKACGRHLDKISTDLLRAMALYREQDERWHEYLKTALTEAENYRFVRPASVFGGAILPLLEQTKWTGDAKWFKAVLTDTRVQASFYPDYLRPRMSPAGKPDRNGNAGAAPDLCGQEQCGDRRDHGH